MSDPKKKNNTGSYYTLVEAFKSNQGNLNNLAQQIDSVSSACSDQHLLGVFAENHDLPRFASYTKDLSLGKNALAFSILADGIPIIYAGQEHQYAGAKDPYNREALWFSGYNQKAPLYVHIAKLNKARSLAIHNNDKYITGDNAVKYTTNNILAMEKGSVLTVLTNAGENGGDSTITVEGLGLSGDVTDILSCEKSSVSDGHLEVKLSKGLPKVYLPSDLLSGSEVC